MYICIYVYMYICIYVYMYICTYVYMYICIYVYMYICIYVYMYICFYVCIYGNLCVGMKMLDSRFRAQCLGFKDTLGGGSRVCGICLRSAEKSYESNGAF